MQSVPMFSNKDMTIHLLNYVPVINVLALMRAFPHIREKKWMTGKKIIERVYAELQKKVHPKVYKPDFVYTGSMLLEVLLGETFDNGKRDVDILCDEEYFDQDRLLDDFPRADFKETTLRMYCGGFRLKTDPSVTVDLIMENRRHYNDDYVSHEDTVNTFDLDCCKNYVSPKCLYIRYPFDLIKKHTTFVVGPRRLLKHTGTADPGCIINESYTNNELRMNKYTKRGFVINVAHEHDNEKDFCNDKNARGFYDIYTLYDSDKHSRVSFMKRLYREWVKQRPPEGVWKK